MMGCDISTTPSDVRGKNADKNMNLKKPADNDKAGPLFSASLTDFCSYTCSSSAASAEADEGGSRQNTTQHRAHELQLQLLSKRVNEREVDASHFTLQDAPILGVGGFGIVRLAWKITPPSVGTSPGTTATSLSNLKSGGVSMRASDAAAVAKGAAKSLSISGNPSSGKPDLDVFAVKSVAKKSILARSSGPTSIFNELACLRLLSEANSAFVCNLAHAFQDSRYLYLALEFCSGGDLRYNLKSQPHHRYTEKIARFLIAQCLLAVSSCHQARVLHRDIKPENLILDVSGYIKLTDFGVSKYFLGATPSAEGDEGDGEDTPEPMVCKSTSGTHGYMPPEIYFKGHLHGKPADYFAVGVTLHELLLGQVRVCVCVCVSESLSQSHSL
eukprot:GSChrysophyteH2.ASY1.ANO1.1531.1 assembled CDS